VYQALSSVTLVYQDLSSVALSSEVFDRRSSTKTAAQRIVDTAVDSLLCTELADLQPHEEDDPSIL
jgi:hypothetical protein